MTFDEWLDQSGFRALFGVGDVAVLRQAWNLGAEEARPKPRVLVPNTLSAGDDAIYENVECHICHKTGVIGHRDIEGYVCRACCNCKRTDWPAEKHKLVVRQSQGPTEPTVFDAAALEQFKQDGGMFYQWQQGDFIVQLAFEPEE